MWVGCGGMAVSERVQSAEAARACEQDKGGQTQAAAHARRRSALPAALVGWLSSAAPAPQAWGVRRWYKTARRWLPGAAGEA